MPGPYIGQHKILSVTTYYNIGKLILFLYLSRHSAWSAGPWYLPYSIH